jgi:hypothetical protein
VLAVPPVPSQSTGSKMKVAEKKGNERGIPRAIATRTSGSTPSCLPFGLEARQPGGTFDSTWPGWYCLLGLIAGSRNSNGASDGNRFLARCAADT